MLNPPLHLPLVYHPDYEMDIGPHVFPTDKYRLALKKLQAAGLAPPEAVHRPDVAGREDLLRVHIADFIDDFENLRWTPRTLHSELPLSAAIVRGFKLAAGGTTLAARLALDGGAAMHLGGGFHHAFAGHAEGFCYINDVAVAIRALQAEGALRRAAVIDVDLHQGNGTAQIFAGDPEVLTFSIHQEDLYPEKQQSDIDIGLGRDTGDEDYLEKLGNVVPSRIADHGPEIVFLVAGADPYEEDQLGDLRLSIQGLLQRDRLVAEACRRRGWPLVAVTAGGYAVDKHDTAAIHAGTAAELARAWGMEAGPALNE